MRYCIKTNVFNDNEVVATFNNLRTILGKVIIVSENTLKKFINKKEATVIKDQGGVHLFKLHNVRLIQKSKSKYCKHNIIDIMADVECIAGIPFDSFKVKIFATHDSRMKKNDRLFYARDIVSLIYMP